MPRLHGANSRRECSWFHATFTDNEDLQFHIRATDWGKLLPLLEAYEDPSEAFTDPKEAATFYADMLETIGQFAAEQIAPFTEELDSQHPVQNGEEVETAPRLAKILNGLVEMGAMGLMMPRRVGGLNLRWCSAARSANFWPGAMCR